MAQAVSRRTLTSEARVRSQVSPCEICGKRSVTVTCFSPTTSYFPSVSFHQRFTLIFIYTLLLAEAKTGETSRSFQQKYSIRNLEGLQQKYAFCHLVLKALCNSSFAYFFSCPSLTLQHL